MEPNPSVNRWLADKSMDRIDHALGRPVWPLRETYRNHFATCIGGATAKVFDASPFWARISANGTMAFYSVTEEGRWALSDHLASLEEPWRAFALTYRGYTTVVPAKTAGKAKYSYFLDVSDSFADLTFGEFCRAVSVRCVT